MAKKYKQGKYIPHNPQKYRGDVNNIVFRSSWEARFMNYLDTTDSVLEWSSETVIIPYLSPVDHKMHRYFVDFWYRGITNSNEVQEFLAEVKPYKETHAPRKRKVQSLSYVNSVNTWLVNSAKWDAAIAFCNKRNMQFKIITEHTLYPNKQKHRKRNNAKKIA